MKTTSLKSVLLLTLLGVFVTGCGKDKDGGGSGSAPAPVNNQYNVGNYTVAPGASQNTNANFKQLITWFNGTQEGSVYVQQGYFSRADFASNSGNNCSTKQILGGIFNIEVCGQVSIGQTQPIANTEVVTCISKNSGGKLIHSPGTLVSGYCQATSSILYVKKNNTQLAKVLSLHSGTLALYDVQVQGGVYTVTAGPKNNGFQSAPSHTYVIDTNLHSIYNPVVIHDLNASKYNSLYK